jgi:hypothetical protein
VLGVSAAELGDILAEFSTAKELLMFGSIEVGEVVVDVGLADAAETIGF